MVPQALPRIVEGRHDCVRKAPTHEDGVDCGRGGGAPLAIRYGLSGRVGPVDRVIGLSHQQSAFVERDGITHQQSHAYFCSFSLFFLLFACRFHSGFFLFGKPVGQSFEFAEVMFYESRLGIAIKGGHEHASGASEEGTSGLIGANNHPAVVRFDDLTRQQQLFTVCANLRGRRNGPVLQVQDRQYRIRPDGKRSECSLYTSASAHEV